MEEANFPFLVVGLGNPGREYRDTRHNIGFMVIERLCAKLGARLNKVQSKALIGSGILEGRKVIMAKPQTFMNLSGQSVGGLVRFYKVPLDQIIIAHDDLEPTGAGTYEVQVAVIIHIDGLHLAHAARGVLHRVLERVAGRVEGGARSDLDAP